MADGVYSLLLQPPRTVLNAFFLCLPSRRLNMLMANASSLCSLRFLQTWETYIPSIRLFSFGILQVDLRRRDVRQKFANFCPRKVGSRTRSAPFPTGVVTCPHLALLFKGSYELTSILRLYTNQIEPPFLLRPPSHRAGR